MNHVNVFCFFHRCIMHLNQKISAMKKNIAFLFIPVAFFIILTFLFSKNSCAQDNESFFESVNVWDNYYSQHPELTNPPSHDFKIFMRWKEFLRNRVYCVDTSLSGKPLVIQSAMNNFLTNLNNYNPD